MTSLALAVVLSSPVTIKVMSFNIRYGTANDGRDRWEVRAPRTRAVIREENADLIGLQEALDFQIDEIIAASSGYAMAGVGRDDGKKAGEFSAILFRKERFILIKQGTFWLSDSPHQIGSKTWGNGITRICTWAQFQDRRSGRNFWHFNTHFDHQSQPSREKSSELILRMVKSSTQGQPVIITGDFNAGEGNSAIQALKQGGFQDSWRKMHPAAPEPGTFNGFQDQYGSSKIDYVFIDSFWKTRSAEIVMTKYRGRWPSDHMPVTAVVEMK